MVIAVKKIVIIRSKEEGIAEDSLPHALEREGYTAMFALYGKEGVEALPDEPFDAIIMDTKILLIESIKIIMDARRLNPEVVVILATNHSDIDSITEARKGLGFDYVINSPEPKAIMSCLHASAKQRQIVRGLEILNKTPRILIVDDETMITNLFEISLNDEGFHAETANCGRDALEMFKRCDYDVVVTDIMMPDISGVNLVGEIKKIKPETVVIVITGYPSVDTATEFIRLGAHDYLAKPLNPDAIISVIGKAWNKRLLELQREELLGQLQSANYLLSETNQRCLEAAEEQKKLQEQLYHAQRLESVGQLAGGVAHDFNNIIMAIVGYASVMQLEIAENDKLQQYLSKILIATERAEKLTGGLLAFSRKQVLHLQPVSTNAIIKDAVSLLEVMIGKDIEIRTLFSKKECFTTADSYQIVQVLVNLSTNARDAMPDGGILTIGTGEVELDDSFVKIHDYGQPGKYAHLFVSDTGTGMDKITRERIFEPFFTTKETGKGTGLGLAIAYGIVKQHNGFINVYSEPGRGTTFNIYLPLFIKEPLTANADSQETSDTVVCKKRKSFPGGEEEILLAEDDEDIRMLMENVLKSNGYRVIAAVNGEDAVNKFTEHKDTVQLLLFDVIMPKTNGMEAYRKIQDMSPDIKAIFMSGYSKDIIQKESVSLDDTFYFISKPISPNVLLEKIREVLST
ncbi:response regulator [Candidatus Kuenenia sp.]|uniref:response regulator n=1 Tax=Candidatus Kuenenia sp. TaxID=2499824 RepID=UPI00321F6582